jgi:hypothetical protein
VGMLATVPTVRGSATTVNVARLVGLRGAVRALRVFFQWLVQDRPEGVDRMLGHACHGNRFGRRCIVVSGVPVMRCGV